jgi:hypothetical protein
MKKEFRNIQNQHLQHLESNVVVGESTSATLKHLDLLLKHPHETLCNVLLKHLKCMHAMNVSLSPRLLARFPKPSRCCKTPRDPRVASSAAGNTATS